MTRPTDESWLSNLDFEAAYQDEQLAPGVPEDMSNTPWDIGEPQPALVDIEASGGIGGAVLDVGCGLGENAIFLARRGHRVTAVDFSPTAVRRAAERAAQRGVEVTFDVADATRLDGFDNRFDTVIDSALFHCLDPEQRRDYVAALHRVSVPGARLHLLCGTASGVVRLPVPHPVEPGDLRASFAEGWRVDDIGEELYTATLDREQCQGLLISQGQDPVIVDELPFDAAGRVRFPVWKLAATRL